jgi:hypothetical protein
MTKIIISLLTAVMPMLLGMVTKEQAKAFLDKMFDLIEEFVADSENAIDDVIVLPIIQKAREFLDVPDLPDDPAE